VIQECFPPADVVPVCRRRTRAPGAERCGTGAAAQVVVAKVQWCGPSRRVLDASRGGDRPSYRRDRRHAADLDLSHPLPEAPWFEKGASWSARRVLLHVIAETAQHAGHADIIRETLDGSRTMG
jgi:hypothetical protein